MITFRIAALGLALATATLAAPVAGAAFVDPLDTPAVPSALAARSLLLGVARAGNRLVAVGQRGHIVYSTDGGASWKQASVPVSSDLTAVFFVDDKQGWVVGHDGVVLHTVDSGDTWHCSSRDEAPTTSCSLPCNAVSRRSQDRRTRRSSSPRRSVTRSRVPTSLPPRCVVRGRAKRLRPRRLQPDLSDR